MKLEFHHINYVSKDVGELDDFYRNILQMEPLSPKNFPRTDATDSSGYAGKIRFVTEGTMQMHLAEQDLTVAAKHSQHINPVERGHIAFRTDDIEAFKALLRQNDIDFADTERHLPGNGTKFSFMTLSAISSRCIRCLTRLDARLAPRLKNRHQINHVVIKSEIKTCQNSRM